MDRLPRWTVRSMLSKIFPRAVVPIYELHQIEHHLEQTLREWKQSVETKFPSLLQPQKLLSQQLEDEPQADKEEDDEDDLRNLVELSHELLERKKLQLQEWPDNKQFMKDLSTLRDLKNKAEFNLTEHREWEKVGIRMEQRRLRKLEKDSLSSSRQYSRACPACQSVNPSKRAVMTNCGHFTCKDCADELADESSGILKCPECGNKTGYVVMIEKLTGKNIKRELQDNNNNNDYTSPVKIRRME